MIAGTRLSFLSIFLLLITISIRQDSPPSSTMNPLNPGYKPTDWLLVQRIFPYEKMNPEAYEATRDQMIQLRSEAAKHKSSGADWEFAGPMNVGGRITDVEMHPSDLQTIYASAATGGIYRSKDQGKVWEQIFEDYETLSIGDMAIANTDKNILFVGSGEPNGGNGSITYDGYGVYKSTDGGDTFTHVGLENAGGIGRVEIDPQNPDRVFVACMGNLFANNPERGIYRTLDGGQTWENVLYISDSTGGIDIAIHPTHPDTIFASMWERRRYATYRSFGGESSGLYRSYDGGDTWEELTNGLPSGQISRIGIGMSFSNPNIIYTHYSSSDRQWIDVFKTIDGGDTWTATNSNIEGNYWEGKIHVDPTNPDKVWSGGVSLWRTTDGAASWSKVSNLWADEHAVYCHPADPNLVIIGDDGGVFISVNGSTTNSKVLTLPITQFYTCEVNPHNINDIMGGTQDRGTQRSISGDVMEWKSIYGGDGFVVKVDPSDEKYMYAASQWGGIGRSTNGGQSFRGAAPSGSNRYNWKTPYIFDPKDPSVMYLGAQYVYRSTNRAVSWTRISNDLTNGEQPWYLGTITTLAVSPVNTDIIYAGTDDGNVWVNAQGGGLNNWVNISEGLPVRWVTCVAADPYDESTAYVTFSGIRYYDYLPHVFKTTDKGQTWTDISSNLPDLPVNTIQIDPDLRDTYYLATDGGVFVSEDGGARWALLGAGMPNAPVLDLNLNQPSRTLLAATYGRSMWRIKLAGTSGVKDAPLYSGEIAVFPNPSLSDVHIEFSLPKVVSGRLSIFDLNGKLVRILKEGDFQSGPNKFSWEGSPAKGLYLAKFESAGFNWTRQIQIIR